MTTVKNIYEQVDHIARFSTKMSFDNVGLLVGDENESVTRVLLALDVTSDVVKEAQTLGATVIVSHHPVIFDTLKRLLPTDPAYLAVRAGIAVISAHTNLDQAAGGVGDTLFTLVSGGKKGTPVADPEGYTLTYIGEFDRETPLADYLAFVKKALPTDAITYVDAKRPVKRIAVCGGAAGDELYVAYENGADTFVTGELKHHMFLKAKELGLNAVMAGHYETENPVMRVLRDALAAALPDVTFLLSALPSEIKHI